MSTPAGPANVFNRHGIDYGDQIPTSDSPTRGRVAGDVRVCNDPTLGVSHWCCTATGNPGTWVPVFSGTNLILSVPFLWNSDEGSIFPGGGGTTSFVNVGANNRFWLAHATRDWRFVIEGSTGQPGWRLPRAPNFWRTSINVNVNTPVGAASFLEMVLFKNDDGSTAINSLVTLSNGPPPTRGAAVAVAPLSGWAAGDVANLSLAIANDGSVSTHLQCDGVVEFFLNDPTGVA